MSDHTAHASLHGEVMTVDKATQLVDHGDALGVSGFTGVDYPKVLPTTLANRGKKLHTKDEEFAVNIYTSASITPDCSGVMTEADIVRCCTPYQEDPALRRFINSGRAKYRDIYLSHSALYVEQGFLPIGAAIVEVTHTTEDGHLVPSPSAGNNVEWMNSADRIAIEVDSWQPEELEGMYNIYYIQHLPSRTPVLVSAPGDHTSTPYIDISLNKVATIIETNTPGRNSPSKLLSETSKAIVGHFLDSFEGGVRTGHLTYG